ncbi:hypothetical protein DTO271G3_824 [Paecilomyces variotii]|nr:hypothetical protein DTO271G3_824 [Paecilomyces variotii]
MEYHQVSLLAYLQHGFVSLPTRNKRNKLYGARDINHVGDWLGFNLFSIQQQFGTVLAAAQIPDEPSNLVPRTINSESAVRCRIDAYLTNRIVRAFQCGFTLMSSTYQMAGRTALNYEVSTTGEGLQNDSADIAIFDPSRPAIFRRNRAPGIVKPSWKWSLDQRNSVDPKLQIEFKQVLSQLNFCMKENYARYGFVLTEIELVAVRRLDRNGNLEVSASIPWTTFSTEFKPKLTVLLGLWYLGMLASNDQDWFLK